MKIKGLLRFLLTATLAMSLTIGTALAAETPISQKITNYNEKQHSTERVDENALSVCTELIEADDRLGLDTKVLTVVYDTEREKTEKIYDWIVENIQYDPQGSSRPLTAYVERKGNDEALSNLITAMLRYLDIPAKTVSGYQPKDETSWSEKVFDQTGAPCVTANHTWTEVFYNNEWHIYDVVCGITQQGYKGRFKNSYFNDFSKTHLILDTGDREITRKATLAMNGNLSVFETEQSKILKMVIENNHNRHDLARDDETALAVYCETLKTNSAPWDPDIKNPGDFLYKDPDGAIAVLSQKLTEDCKTAQEKAKKIHDWVAGNISYNYDNFKAGIFSSDDSEAHLTLSDKIGICSGYSSLMAALLREAGIPAKQVSGCTVKDENSKWQSSMFDNPGEIVANHAWTEAFFDGKWHTYDPTWDSRN